MNNENNENFFKRRKKYFSGIYEDDLVKDHLLENEDTFHQQSRKLP